jgi:hypothetical protein
MEQIGLDLLKARRAMSKEERSTAKLERADLARSNPGQTLPNQLGHRLRTVFQIPETQEENFAMLLEQTSTRLS